MKRRAKILALLVIAASTIVHTNAWAHDLPYLGTNSYVQYEGGTECLTILDTEWKAGQQSGATDPYMDTYLLDGVPDSGAWLGFVPCTQFFEAYEINEFKFYNQRMAVSWRTSEAEGENFGRLHSWVQNYGCLSVPQAADKSILLQPCELGSEEQRNQLEFVDATGKLELQDGRCLIPSANTVSWPAVKSSKISSLTVRPILPGDCSDERAKGWSFAASEVVTYPMPDTHVMANPAYVAFLFNESQTFIEPSAGYSYFCEGCYFPPSGPSENYYSWYTPFLVRNNNFPVQVKVCSVEGLSSKGAAVMSFDQTNRIQNVTEIESNCVQFDLHSFGQVSIVFPEGKPEDHLALFVDPFEAGRGDLKGCTAENPCPDGTYFIGPGYYASDSPICANHLSADSQGHSRLTSPVVVELAGGAALECRVNANVGAHDGDGTSVLLRGKGAIDGASWLGMDGIPDPLLLACADHVEIDGIVIANPKGRTQGNLVANSPWMCSQDLYENGQVEIQYAKQIGGFEGQADGFDVGSYSHISYSFIESNDDGIKMIGSHQKFTNMTLWKNQYGWAVDCGWGAASTKIDSVTVNGVDIPFIKQPDKQCCNGDSCPAPNQSCPGYNDCQDPTGKVAAIGCQIGRDVALTNYSINSVTVRNPINESNATPVNLLQRGFAIGIADNYNGEHYCPHLATLKELTLSNLYFPHAQNESRFFVDSGPDAEIEGTFRNIYQNCSEPGFNTTGCEELTEGGFETSGNVKVPEPGGLLAPWACLLALGAIRSVRRRDL